MKIIQNVLKLKDEETGLDWGTGGTYQIESIKFLSEPGDLTVKIYKGEEWKYGESDGSPIDYPGGDPCQPFAGTVEHRSLKLDWHIPGAYLFADSSCQGTTEFPDPMIFQSSSAALSGFDNKAHSMKIMYGDCDPEHPGDFSLCKDQYAAVLHEHQNMMGDCKICEDTPADGCQSADPLSGQVSSITIYLKSEDSAGPGVKFYEDKNYEGDSIGYYGVGDEPNVGDFNDKATAVEIDGNYLAVLFEDNNYGGKCEVFTHSDPNLRDNSLGQCGFLGRGDCLTSFKIRAKK